MIQWIKDKLNDWALPTTEETVRFSVVFTREDKERLDKLTERAGITANDGGSASTVGVALAVYDFLLTVREQGGKIIVDRGGDQTEFAFYDETETETETE